MKSIIILTVLYYNLLHMNYDVAANENALFLCTASEYILAVYLIASFRNVNT